MKQYKVMNPQGKIDVVDDLVAFVNEEFDHRDLDLWYSNNIDNGYRSEDDVRNMIAEDDNARAFLESVDWTVVSLWIDSFGVQP
jgi:hypothetical protein